MRVWLSLPAAIVGAAAMVWIHSRPPSDASVFGLVDAAVVGAAIGGFGAWVLLFVVGVGTNLRRVDRLVRRLTDPDTVDPADVAPQPAVRERNEGRRT